MKTLFKMPPIKTPSKLPLAHNNIQPSIKPTTNIYKPILNNFLHNTPIQSLPKTLFTSKRFTSFDLVTTTSQQTSNMSPQDTFNEEIKKTGEKRVTIAALGKKIHHGILEEIILKPYYVGQLEFSSYLSYCRQHDPERIIELANLRHYDHILTPHLVFEAKLKLNKITITDLEQKHSSKIEIYNLFTSPIYCGNASKEFLSGFHYVIEKLLAEKIFHEMTQHDLLEAGLKSAMSNPDNGALPLSEVSQIDFPALHL